MSKRVLLIEDDPDIVDIISINLPKYGFSVEALTDGVSGLERARRGGFDLAVLDLMLPGIDGLEICRELRAENKDVFIIITSGRDGESDKVVGLELGADDYLTKPYSVVELVARMKVLFRREEATRNRVDSSAAVLTFGGLMIDPEMRLVTVDSNTISLTAIEFDLLLFLARHPGRPFTREELAAHVWDSTASGVDGTISAQLSRLRKRLEKDPKNPKYVKTVWGIGYQFARREELE